MQRQTFIDHMKERGYNVTRTINGNQRGHQGTIGAACGLRRLHRNANHHRDNRKGCNGRRKTTDNRRPDSPALTAYMRVQVPQGH